MAMTTMVHVRVNEQIKIQAADTLAKMGLTIFDAVRVFLMSVMVEKKMPSFIKKPNAKTRSAMIEADEIARAHSARFTSTEYRSDTNQTLVGVSHQLVPIQRVTIVVLMCGLSRLEL
jgi:DNA-damage-inducible protein J